MGIDRDPGINRVPGYRFQTRVPVPSTTHNHCGNSISIYILSNSD